MATIKKVYEEIHAFLEANKDLKVSKIIAEVEVLMSAKTGGGGKANFHRNEAGEVVAVQCYYFKRWFPVAEMPIGAKKSSASGLSSMTKEGTSNWTKQQAAAKKAKDALLSEISTSTEAIDIAARLAEIDVAKDAILEPVAHPGFDTLEECLQAIGQ